MELNHSVSCHVISCHFRYGGRSIFLDPPTVGCKDGQWHVTIPASWNLPAVVGTSDAKLTGADTLATSFPARDDVFCRGRDTSTLSRVYMDHISAQLQPFLLPAGGEKGEEGARIGQAVAAALMIEPGR